MAKVTKKAANELLEAGYISQEQYEAMFADGVVSAGTRASRPQIHVPADKKAEFVDQAYELLGKLAEKMNVGEPTPDSGVVTIYLKGAGKPRTATGNDTGANELSE